MAGVNKVIIIGRLGNDPEMRYMSSGEAVANLSIATSESWTDKTTGAKREKTEWNRVVAFRKLAEIIGGLNREKSLEWAENARTLAMPGSAGRVAEAAMSAAKAV